jgi:hypothetical protein
MSPQPFPQARTGPRRNIQCAVLGNSNNHFCEVKFTLFYLNIRTSSEVLCFYKLQCNEGITTKNNVFYREDSQQNYPQDLGQREMRILFHHNPEIKKIKKLPTA